MSEHTGNEASKKAAPSEAKGTLEPPGQIRLAMFKSLTPPPIQASALKMAQFLDDYAEQLRHVANQLRKKKEGEIISLPWPPHGILTCECGDGGGD